MSDNANNSLIEFYAKYSLDELHDQLDQVKEKLKNANAVYMRTGLASDKDAIETASIRFYNLQIVIRERGNG